MLTLCEDIVEEFLSIDIMVFQGCVPKQPLQSPREFYVGIVGRWFRPLEFKQHSN